MTTICPFLVFAACPCNKLADWATWNQRQAASFTSLWGKSNNLSPHEFANTYNGFAKQKNMYTTMYICKIREGLKAQSVTFWRNEDWSYEEKIDQSRYLFSKENLSFWRVFKNISQFSKKKVWKVIKNWDFILKTNNVIGQSLLWKLSTFLRFYRTTE